MIKYFFFILLITPVACNSENDVVNKQVDKTLTRQNHYIGKPHAPIAMRYTTDAKKTVSVGQLLTYKIYFSASVDATNLEVRYKTKGDLLIQNSSMSFIFGEQRKGKKNLLELGVIPQQEGLFYIYLSATLDINGRKQSRSFVIPVQVGEPVIEKQLNKSASPGVLNKQNAESPGIISMPAVETTR